MAAPEGIFRHVAPIPYSPLPIPSSHTGGSASTTGTPGGGVKWKVSTGMGALGNSPVKVKRVRAPSASSISMPVIAPFASHGESEPSDALLLALGLAGKRELAVERGPDGEVVQFFFQFRVAQQKTQRGAQIVELAAGMRCTCGSPRE